MTVRKPKAILKPTVDTEFHIDYEWWERNKTDYRSYMVTHLPSESQQDFLDNTNDVIMDFVDPVTAEVRRHDPLGYALSQAAQAPDFINLQLSLVDSVFRVFLANRNSPLTPKDLAAKTGRSASVILKTIGGVRVYRGIRPIQQG